MDKSVQHLRVRLEWHPSKVSTIILLFRHNFASLLALLRRYKNKMQLQEKYNERKKLREKNSPEMKTEGEIIVYLYKTRLPHERETRKKTISDLNALPNGEEIARMEDYRP